MLKPDVDESPESEIRCEIGRGKDLHGGGTSIVALRKPSLNGATIVSDAGAEAHRRLHYVHGYRTSEKARNGNV